MPINKDQKTELPLDKWLLKYADDCKSISKRGEDARTQITVLLHRRFRETSLSDRVGRFILGGTGRWKGDDIQDLEGVDMKCINVVKPTVKMNMTALSSARVAVKNEGANKSPRLRGVANVADGIVKYLDEHEEHWTGNLETRINQLSQLGYGYFVRARHNPHKRTEKVQTQEWQDGEIGIPGEYACISCGARGPFDRDEETEVPDQIACPVCGDPAEVVKMPDVDEVPVPGQTEEFSPGDIETTVSSCLEHRIDERNSQGGNLNAARWFEHHYLVTEGELETEFGQFNFGPEGEWCYALKWKWSLETGEDVFEQNFQTENYRQRWERRDIYVLPEEYSQRIEPVDFEMKDGHGNVVFSIARGERLVDKRPNGFVFSVVSEKLAPNRLRPVDFRKEWSYGCYMPDAHSFWGQPLVELIQVQDDWNTLYTIDVQHRERNSLNQITYNRLMYDADSWEQDLVPTAEGMTQPDNTPLSHYFAQVQAMPMNEAVSGLKFLYDLLPYIGGASPAAIGVPAKGRDTTYHAQLLQKQSSLGQLQPAGESKANAKVWHFRNFMRLTKEHWPPARFEYIRTRFGEEWKADDVEAFMEADIDRDVVTSFVEGSEIPTSLIERRIDMETVINKYIEAQIPPPQQLIKQYLDLLGIDYDLGGMEADERLAEARYEKIREGVQVLGQQFSPEPTITIDPQSGQQIPGPSPLCQKVLSHPGLIVKQRENHQTHLDFYIAKEKALMAQDEPDMVLIECLDAMMELHDNGGVAQTQDLAAQEVAGQAPIVAAQMAMQGGGEEAPAGPDPQQLQMEAEQQAADRDAEMADSEAERDFKALESERQRDHELQKIDKENAFKGSLESMKLSAQEKLVTIQTKAAAAQAKTKQKQAA